MNTEQRKKHAEILFSSGKIVQAQRVYESICAQQPADAEAWARLGTIYGRLGKFSEGRQCCQKALAMQPGLLEANLTLGNILASSGQLENALATFRIALSTRPDLPIIWFNIGAIEQQLGHIDEARGNYRKAIELRPDFIEAHIRLARIFAQQGQFKEAERALNSVLKIKPGHSAAYGGLAEMCCVQNRLGEAERFYRCAIERNPTDRGLHIKLGDLLARQGKFESALACYRNMLEGIHGNGEVFFRIGSVYQKMSKLAEADKYFRLAEESQPANYLIYYQVGKAYNERGNFEKAAASYKKALEVNPAMAAAYNDLGAICQVQNKLDDAKSFYKKALKHQPDYVEALSNLAGILGDQGYVDESIEYYDRAIKLRPRDTALWFNKGCMLQENDRLLQAEEVYRQALQINADLPRVHNNMANMLQKQSRFDEAKKHYSQALKHHPDVGHTYSNYLLYTNYDPTWKLKNIYHEHLLWGERFGGKGKGVVFRNSKAADRPLKIGYVSGDFRGHSVAYFCESLLRYHERSQVEVSCYSNSGKVDSMTGRLQGLADRWVAIVGLSDEQVTEQIRSDEIDILVDLGGHTENNRLGVFARRAAPVQVSYIGYPNTTGLKEMDYRLTDAWADPEKLNPDQYYTEQLIRLKGGFLSYTPPQASPAVSALPALANGHITFGSFNNLAKVNEQVVKVWSQILKAVPGSRLLLKNKSLTDSGTKERYWKLFESEGIERERLELLGHIASQADHLNSYNRIDMGLDPFPYNGTTTTCEALWMGVPVVVLAGDRHAARVGVSLLSQAGLDEWIAEDEKEYIDLAVARAKDPEQLVKLRAGFRGQLQFLFLCDGKRLAGEVEQAYREMWRKWCGAQER